MFKQKKSLILILSLSTLTACVESPSIPSAPIVEEKVTIATSEFWQTPSTQAISNLISSGESVNFVNEDGQTPLMLSIIRNHANTYDFANLLINSGANVNVKNSAGMTPLMLAIVQNPSNVLEIAELLIKAGADVNAKDNNGQTPLMLSIAFSNSVKMIDLLVRNGARIDEKDNLGMTALMYVSQSSGNVNLAKALLLCGADINVVDNSNMTSLAHLMRDNTTTSAHEILTLYIELEEIDLTIRNNDGELAFNHALFNEAIYNSRPYWTLKDLLMRKGITDLFFIQKNR